VKKITLVLAATILLSACASSEIRGYTDPAYNGHKFTHLLVGVNGANFATQELFIDEIVSRLEDEGVEAESFNSVFPPTRPYTDKEMYDVVNRLGLDAALFVSLGGSAYSDQVIGYQTYGTAQSYGNSAYGNTVTVPMRSVSRADAARLSLVDLSNGNTVWLGDAETAGQGLLNTTDEAIAGALADEIINTLQDEEHL
jgi:hypothetical protein